MEKEVLGRIRAQLEEERQKLISELKDLGFGVDGSVDVKFDEGFADAAHTTSERAKVFSMADRLKQHLADTDAALERIERGTYGNCAICGKPIAPERLEAVPTASMCIDCKKKER